MPKFSVVQLEDAKYIVQFEADNIEHAKELLEEATDFEELPNSHRFWKNGATDFEMHTLTEGGVFDPMERESN